MVTEQGTPTNGQPNAGRLEKSSLPLNVGELAGLKLLHISSAPGQSIVTILSMPGSYIVYHIYISSA